MVQFCGLLWPCCQVHQSSPVPVSAVVLFVNTRVYFCTLLTKLDISLAYDRFYTYATTILITCTSFAFIKKMMCFHFSDVTSMCRSWFPAEQAERYFTFYTSYLISCRTGSKEIDKVGVSFMYIMDFIYIKM